MRSGLNGPTRVFHGWWIVLAGFIIQMVGSGLGNHSAGAFMVVLQGEFGWSKALISGAFAAAIAQAGLVAPIQGRLVHAIGPRAVVRFGVLCMGAGLAGLGTIGSVASLYLVVLLIGLGYSLTSDVALQTAVIHWFHRKRGTALGLMSSGFGAGGVLVPAVANATTAFGWRLAALMCGATIAVVGLVAAQVLTGSPEERGEVPDGRFNRLNRPSVPVSAEPAEFSAGEALRTPSFWLLASGQAFLMFGVTAVGVHLVPYAVEHLGFSLGGAGWLMTLFLACAVAGNLVGGIVGDRVDKRAAMVLLTVVQASALALLVFGGTVLAALLFAAVHGLTVGARSPLGLSIRADYFGRKAYATVWGVSLLVANLGSVAGMVATGYLADRFGSYRIGFAGLLAVTLCSALLFAAARRPEPAPSTALGAAAG